MSVLFVSYSLISFNFYLFYFPGTTAEPLGSARGALRAPRSTGWELLAYSLTERCSSVNGCTISTAILWAQGLKSTRTVMNVHMLRNPFVWVIPLCQWLIGRFEGTHCSYLQGQVGLMTCENFSISKLARISDANTDFGLDIGPPLWMQRNVFFWNSLFYILFVSSLSCLFQVMFTPLCYYFRSSSYLECLLNTSVSSEILSVCFKQHERTNN